MIHPQTFSRNKFSKEDIQRGRKDEARLRQTREVAACETLFLWLSRCTSTRPWPPFWLRQPWQGHRVPHRSARPEEHGHWPLAEMLLKISDQKQIGPADPSVAQ